MYNQLTELEGFIVVLLPLRCGTLDTVPILAQ